LRTPVVIVFFAAMAFSFGNFFAAMRDPLNAAEQNSEDGDEIGDA
jgi:hypothetical protein